MKRFFAWRAINGAVLLVLVMVGGAFAKSVTPLDLNTEKVVIFKDGYSLFSKQATGTTDGEGKVYLSEVPTAVLGTFWVVSADGAPISLKSEMIEVTTAETVIERCTTMADLVRASVGRFVEIQLSDQVVRGKVIALLEDDVEPLDLEDKVVPYSGGALTGKFSSLAPTSLLPPSPGQLVSLRDADDKSRVYIFPASDIKMMTQLAADGSTKNFKERNSYERLKVEQNRQKRLTIDFGPSSANQEVSLRVFYFSEGLQWIPTYRLDGDLNGDATLSLQGEIINDAEDIEGAVAKLVVGVPHIRFRDQISSLSLEKTFRRALHSSSSNQYQTQMFLNNAISVSAGNGGGNMGIRPPLDEALDGEQSSEFFLYTLDRLDLPKGACAAFPLDTAKVKPFSLYRLDIQLKRDQNQAVMGRGKSSFSSHDRAPLTVEQNSVWQVLEVVNTGNTPWTTGPVLVMDKGLPVSQELLAFTPPGGTVEIPLTIATRVRGIYEERQTARESNALRWNDYNYAKITKEGTITISNNLAKSESIKVTFSTGGSVVSVSDEGKFSLDDYRSEDWGGSRFGYVNQHSEMEWKLDLVPGEKKDLTYTLEYFFRN